ncbi:DUF1413 domain-containing protein [Salipiger mucosus]|uniref:DUF1413 domain-containing protein n=1 Tax=Salipiger mucosus DSM 16094 TaxID=1123237 RepID=S9QS75_9RHOB|nr:DUF1413 domain-containing protein [Salipiger mucosus]EPX82482.1 hypothetical protein Salmuc_05231 [Salipiger mucosus DSM 16094]
MDASLLDRLRRHIEDRAPGEFHFPEVYGAGWKALPIGDRVRLGHAFLDAVRRGDLPGVEDTGRKADGGRIYRKIG